MPIVVWRSKRKELRDDQAGPVSLACLLYGSASKDISCARVWPLASLRPKASTNPS
jgi:hypothetical protein